MPAFDLTTELFNFFRREAQKLGCNPCMDRHIKKIELMNSKGVPGKPACLCKVNTSCPCEDVIRELEADVACYCGIFERV
jgi:ferredoxin-thioredoxin reductase catalytic subunit